jgi:hypothetical protein
MSTWTCWLCHQRFPSPLVTRGDGTTKAFPPGWQVCATCRHTHGPFSASEKFIVGSQPPKLREAALRNCLKRRRVLAAAERPDPLAGVPPGYAGFLSTLTDHYLPATPRAIRQWQTLAKRDAGCTTWHEASACIAYLATQARAAGVVTIYPETLLPWLRDWRHHRGPSPSASTPSPASASPATPSAANPTPCASTT